MLDLGFVRANLELVEEKLRHRGQDPAELLGDFKSLDARRREAITEAEQLKAQRNKLSEEVAKKKKAGEDASAIMEQIRWHEGAHRRRSAIRRQRRQGYPGHPAAHSESATSHCASRQIRGRITS